MGTICEALQDFNLTEDAFVNLTYTDHAEVWHITDDYIVEALSETTTASMLADLLSTQGLTVYSRWDEDILAEMRDNGLLDDYDREEWFGEYLTEVIQQEAYQYDLLSVTTEKHDHKRGVCEIQASVKVPADQVLALGDKADTLFGSWDVSIRTSRGVLTLE